MRSVLCSLLALSFVLPVAARDDIDLAGKQIPVVAIGISRDIVVVANPTIEYIAKQAVANDDFGWADYARKLQATLFNDFSSALPFTFADEKAVLANEGYIKLKADAKFAPVKDVAVPEGYITCKFPGNDEKLAIINSLNMGESVMFASVAFGFVQDMKNALIAGAESRMKKYKAQTVVTLQVYTKVGENKVKKSFSLSDNAQSKDFIEVDTWKEKPLERYTDFKPLFEESFNSILSEMAAEAKAEYKK